MLGDARFMSANLEMDLDGGVSVAKEDLAKVPRGSREFLADIGNQVLHSLEMLAIPLPSRKLQPNEEWKVQRDFSIGNAFFAVPAQVDVVYKYIGIQKADNIDRANLLIHGVVRGRKGRGDDVVGIIRGSALISKETGEVVAATVGVNADMDIVRGNRAAQAFGSITVAVKRSTPAEKEVPNSK